MSCRLNLLGAAAVVTVVVVVAIVHMERLMTTGIAMAAASKEMMPNPAKNAGRQWQVGPNNPPSSCLLLKIISIRPMNDE